jgi:glycosyltransferase involved in cell wall biosynthesis
MKKILWINPSFLDYRIPVYKKLNELSNNNLFLIYSKNRSPNRIIDKTKEALSNNAFALENERSLNVTNDNGFSNSGVSLVLPVGLFSRTRIINPDILISEGFGQWTPFALIYSIFKRKELWISYERTIFTERNCPKWRTLYRKVINLFVKGYLVNGKLTTDYLTKVICVKNKLIKVGCMSADSEGLSQKKRTFNENEKVKLIEQLKLNNSIRFLFVGRIIELKGLKYLLEAWTDFIQNNNLAELIIIGEGDQKEFLKQKYTLDKSIHILGMVDYDEIYKYYSIADVFILPTLEDNWSLVVPEAMACGLPIATSIYNGCHPELVKPGENGCVFNPLSKISIVDTLNYFLKNKEKLKEMGQKSVDIESQYTTNKVAKRIFDAVNSKEND